MMLNQYSFVMVVVLIVIGAVVWATLQGWGQSQVLVVAGVVVLSVLIAVLMQRQATESALPEVLRQGKPVLVEYYSDY
jgi:low affinity Fe/Cu permease